MSNVPGDLKYTKDHEWVRIEEDGSVVIGITDHAQQALGDLVFVEVPEVDQTLTSGEGVAVVESVKAASDVYAPCAGTVVEVNGALADQPELINSDPYGEGWIARLTPADKGEVDAMMDAATYDQFLIETEDA
ncbi:MAG: glycine cleavage system protein GcvH [Pseudomonadota bacterium]